MNFLMFEKTLRVTYRKKVFILINDCEQKQTEKNKQKSRFQVVNELGRYIFQERIEKSSIIDQKYLKNLFYFCVFCLLPTFTKKYQKVTSSSDAFHIKLYLTKDILYQLNTHFCIKKEPTLFVQFLHQYKETRSTRTLIVQED